MNTDAQATIESRSIPVPESGCWLWLAYVGKNGYGRNSTGRHRYQESHRASYEAFHGPIPKSLCVCHKCDTPTCVNPDHLFLGTHRENMGDRARKVSLGLRQRNATARRKHVWSYNKGESNGRAKLTADHVREIRNSGKSCRALSMIYSVSPRTILDAISGRNWSHIS